MERVKETSERSIVSCANENEARSADAGDGFPASVGVVDKDAPSAAEASKGISDGWQVEQPSISSASDPLVN